MFALHVKGKMIGVVAEPYESHAETIQVGYILVDGSHLDEHGLGFSAKIGLDQTAFDLVDGEDNVVYEQCLIHSVARVLYMENQRGVLLEDSRIQFLRSFA